MPWILKNHQTRRTALRHAMAVLTASFLLAPGAAAQSEEAQSPLPPPEAGAEDSKPLEPSTRAAVTAARRQLENAVGGDDGNVRWIAIRASRVLSSPWIAEAVVPFCDSPNTIERVLALEVVANTNPGAGRAAFLHALGSGERSIRLRGVLGLAEIGDEESLPYLTNILKDDPDPDLRAAAARALAEISDPRAVIPLYEAIESPYPPVREQAVLSLLRIGERGVGEYLIEHLREDRDPGEAETLRLLALVPDPGLIDSLTPYLERSDAEIRTLAAAAVISIVERYRPRRR